MKNAQVLCVAFFALIQVHLSAQTIATFDFENHQPGSTRVSNLVADERIPWEERREILLGAHSFKTNWVTPSNTSINIEARTTQQMHLLNCGFFVDNICSQKVKAIEFDIEYGVAGNPLYISTNGTTSFQKFEPGDTKIINGVTVHLDAQRPAGSSGFTGKLRFSGRKIESIYVAPENLPSVEFYVDNVTVGR